MPNRRSFPFAIGHRQGSLEVLEYRLKGKCYQPFCRCDCGKEYIVERQKLSAGQQSCMSCATPRRVASFKAHYGYEEIVADPMLRLRLQWVIAGVYRRCYDPKFKYYKYYGGRGIAVADEWRDSPQKFMAYLTTLPGWDAPDLELDRRDNEKGYEPGNLRYVTHRVNCQNRRKPKR